MRDSLGDPRSLNLLLLSFIRSLLLPFALGLPSPPSLLSLFSFVLKLPCRFPLFFTHIYLLSSLSLARSSLLLLLPLRFLIYLSFPSSSPSPLLRSSISTFLHFPLLPLSFALKFLPLSLLLPSPISLSLLAEECRCLGHTMRGGRGGGRRR